MDKMMRTGGYMDWRDVHAERDGGGPRPRPGHLPGSRPSRASRRRADRALPAACPRPRG
jgi:hypothetical protein